MPVTRSMQGRVEAPTEGSATDTSSTARDETRSQTTTSQVTIEETVRAGHRPSQPSSRRSSKKSDWWAARERLAKAKAETELAKIALRLAKAEAEAELAEIALQRQQAGENSSDEEDREQSDLASVRISKWLQQRPGEGPSLPVNNLEEIPGEARAEKDHGAREHRTESQPGRVTELDPVQRTIGLEELTAALTKRDSPRYLHELPVYNGQVSGWLAFKAAFRDSELAFSKAENVARMRKSLKSVAYEAVSSPMVGQPDPGAIMEALERRFGRPEALVLAEMEKLRHLPKESDGDWKRARVKKQSRQMPIKTSQKRKVKFIGLEAHFLIRAEQLWVLTSQRESFGEDFERVKQQKAPSSSGRLAALSVAMGTDGTLRLRGRISRTPELAEETASPAILDGKHKYTKLYIQHVHEKLHHGGVEAVVNELRQRAWIVKIRPAVKDVIKGCLYCRIKKAKPGRPATGDLPEARLAHHMRAFTYTGLDYFGPLQVTVARHTEKRYVALFTCMTTRAIHLEVVGSLSADSAICALRRFIARRGCPREMMSDNATCFKAADRELRAALLEAVEEEVNSRHITWRYIPPAAPFMGGAWERMVRSVKEALTTTLHEKSPKEETLVTLLAEVEATVNSRPLTHVAVNPDDREALTPNHLLLGPNSHIPAPGVFSEDDDHARQHWRRVQRLADEFWRRWLREYLPALQHRREPHTTGEPPKVGDLVVICDENLPRNTWPRGRITALHPGRDGVVRVVDVTTSAGHVLRRPTRKIVVLPVRAS